MRLYRVWIFAKIKKFKDVFQSKTYHPHVHRLAMYLATYLNRQVFFSFDPDKTSVFSNLDLQMT